MSAARTVQEFLALFRVALPERDVRVGTMMAAAFNLFGMPIELLILRHYPAAKAWPCFLSMAVGLVILLAEASKRLEGRRKLSQLLFVVNGTAVVFALAMTAPFYATLENPWIPFQASKLGALVAGLLAPGFVAGLATIAITVGVPMAQVQFLPASVAALLKPVEPWALLGFGLGGAFVLAHRLRVRRLELRALAAQAEAETTRRMAQAYLELRDLMNTPLQSIEIATRLLQERKTGQDEAILDALRRSCERLGEISQRLKKFEHALEWKEGRGGLGD